jgi:hypothetical protein
MNILKKFLNIFTTKKKVQPQEPEVIKRLTYKKNQNV